MAICQTILAISITAGLMQLVLSASQQDCSLSLLFSQNNNSYDLTSVAFRTVNITSQSGGGGRPPLVALRLCGGPGPCPDGAAACVTDPETGRVTAAGRLAADMHFVVKDSMGLQLDLAPGGNCTSKGQTTTFNTSINFICQNQDSTEGRQALLSDCSLLVLWTTPAACPAPAGCPLLSYAPYRGLAGLAELAAAPLRAEHGGEVFEARLCGGNASCAAQVCVSSGPTGGQRVTIGDVGRPPRLTAENGTVTLTYGQDGGDQAEIRLVCRRSAGSGRLVFRRRSGKLIQLDLESSTVCLARQVNCQVTGSDGRQRDLSPLTRVSGAWETTDRTGAEPDTRFFVNLCRSLGHTDALPDLCPGEPGTAVCMQSSHGKTTSLGRVGDPPSVKSDGSIEIVYTNGSQCGGGTYSSEIQLLCGQTEGEPVFQGRRGDCRFTFVWETTAACGDLESSGSACRVRDPLYGHQLDVSSLRRQDEDYAIHLGGGRTLYVNLCGALIRRCAGKDGQGACLVTGRTETSYGAASSRLVHSDGVLSLTMTGGAACGSGANHSTRVVFACHQGAPAAAELGLAHTTDCDTYLVLPARQACQPHRTTSCRTPDGRFDLSGLTALTGNHMYHEPNATYVLNVCHSVNAEEGVSCPADAGACILQPGEKVPKDRFRSLGVVSGGPTVENGQAVIHYTSGEPCLGKPGKQRATVIRFHCDKNGMGKQPELVYTDGCRYEFGWNSPYACPLEEAHGTANCTVVNPQTGYKFDLSPLSRPGGYTASLFGTEYQLNVCSPLSQPGNCTAGTGVCKTTSVNPSSKISAGMANDRLVYDDGVIFLNYSGGAPCGGDGRRYSTVISFVCGAETAEPRPAVVEDDLCAVAVHWHTPLACETRVACHVDTPSGLVDLTPLIRHDLGYTVTAASASAPADHHPRFTVNVCRPLGPAGGRACPAGSAACRTSGTDGKSLGHVHNPPRLVGDHVSLIYEHGSPCSHDPSQNLTTEIQLHCNSSMQGMGGPEPPEYALCRYTFQWSTPAACPLSPAAAEARRLCRVRTAGKVADLNTLTADGPRQLTYSGQTVTLSPCQTSDTCSGALCVDSISYGDEVSFTVRREHDRLVMQYTGGTPCEEGGKVGERGSTLRLSCDPAAGRGTPRVTNLTQCHLAVEWASSAVCSVARPSGSHAPSGTSPPATKGTGHFFAWLLVFAIACVLVGGLVCRARWRGRCHALDALRRQLLSPGTRATAHYRPVRVEDPDESETALLLDGPLADLESPRPARRHPAPPPPPPPPGGSPGGLADVPLDAPTDSDDELLVV